jgi:hypothetical protein
LNCERRLFWGKEKKGTQEIQEIIGDNDQEDFFPQVEAKFWDNECKLSVRYLSDEEGEEIIDTDKEKVKWRKGREEARFYQKENERHESGEFEFDILLDEYTGKNEWVFSIRTRGLKFYRQEALTPEEIEQGASRPDWITGGYCVYHESKKNHVIKKRYTGDWQETPEPYSEMSLREEVSKKKKGEKGFDEKIEKGKYYSREYEVVDTTNYATGKVCNIPLPVAIDAEGNETFGTVDIDEEKGEMRVGVSDEWLKKAKYPVTIDPTLGYTTMGSSWPNVIADSQYSSGSDVDYMASSAWTMPEDGTLDKITLGLHPEGDSTTDVKAVLHEEDSGGTGVHGVIAEIANAGVSLTDYDDIWVDFTASGESLDNGTSYLIGGIADASSADSFTQLNIPYDSTGASTNHYSDNTEDYTSISDPWYATSYSINSKFSAYITYSLLSSPEIEQEGFAFGDDDGSESGHTLGTQDTNVTAPLGTKTLRTILDATDDPTSKAFKLKYQKNGSGGYSDVPVGAGSSGGNSIAVETFDKDFGVDGDTHTLTNDVGATSKAFIRLNSSLDKGSGGPTGSTGNATPNVMGCGLQLTASDTITANKDTSTTVKCVGEVWRYEGEAGGANEFIVHHYAIAASGASTSQDISSDITNRNDCVPIITGYETTKTSVNDFDQTTFAAHIDSSGNLVVSSGNSGASGTVYISVVEFTGSNWSVGHGVSSSHDSSIETVTLNTDSTGTGGSTFDVGDWETAWIEASMGGDSSETGLSDVMALIYPTTASTTQVEFDVVSGDSSARNDATGYVHVIQNDDLIVKRVSSNVAVTEGDGSYGTTLGFPSGTNTTRDADQLALEWFCDTTGTGKAHGRGRLNARITDPTGDIDHWVHRSGNNIIARYAVIDLSQLIETSSNEIYVSTSSNVTAGGEATTARLTAPSGKTTGDFTTGRRWDDENGDDSIDIASDEYTELEWVITTQDLETDDYIEFRVYDGDDALDTYTLTPKWTIGSGSTNATAYPSVDSVSVSDPAVSAKGDANKSVSVDSVEAGDNAVTASGGAGIVVSADSVNIADPAVSLQTTANVSVLVDSVSVSDPAVSGKGSAEVSVSVDLIEVSDESVSANGGASAAISADEVAVGGPAMSASGTANVSVSVDEVSIVDNAVEAFSATVTVIGVDEVEVVDNSVSANGTANVNVSADLVSVSDPDVNSFGSAGIVVSVDSVSVADNAVVATGGAVADVSADAVLVVDNEVSIVGDASVAVLSDDVEIVDNTVNAQAGAGVSVSADSVEITDEEVLANGTANVTLSVDEVAVSDPAVSAASSSVIDIINDSVEVVDNPVAAVGGGVAIIGVDSVLISDIAVVAFGDGSVEIVVDSIEVADPAVSAYAEGAAIAEISVDSVLITDGEVLAIGDANVEASVDEIAIGDVGLTAYGDAEVVVSVDSVLIGGGVAGATGTSVELPIGQVVVLEKQNADFYVSSKAKRFSVPTTQTKVQDTKFFTPSQDQEFSASSRAISFLTE